MTTSGSGGRLTAFRRDPVGPLVILALLALVLIQFLRASDPFDLGDDGSVTAMTAAIARNFDRLGFARLGFRPALVAVPGVPSASIPYLNHPPWPQHAFAAAYGLLGRDERALRLPMILATLLLALSPALLPGPRRRRQLGVLLASSLPVVILHGDLPDATPLLAALIPAYVVVEARSRDGACRPSRRFAPILAFLLGLIDWTAYLVVPVLVVDIMRTSTSRADSRRAIARILLPLLTAAALDLAFLVHAYGNLGLVIDHLERMVRVVSGRDRELIAEVSLRTLARSAREHALESFGISTILAALFGLFALPFGRRSGGSPATHRLEPKLLAVALAIFAVFRSRACTIQFWMLFFAPVLASLAAGGLLAANAWIGRRIGRPLTETPVMAAVLMLAFCGHVEALRRHRLEDGSRLRIEGRTLSALTAPDDMVITPGTLAGNGFYVDAVVVPMVDGPERLKAVRDRLAPGRSLIRRVWLLAPVDLDPKRLDWMRAHPALRPETLRVIDLCGRAFRLMEADRDLFFAG